MRGAPAVLFWFVIVPGLILFGLFGGLGMATTEGTPGKPAASVESRLAGQAGQEAAFRLRASVAVEELSLLSAVPPSNLPAEFGPAEVAELAEGAEIAVLGRYSTVLENGVSADFLVVDRDGRKALVFYRLLEGPLTTGVSETGFGQLPELAFP